MTITPNAPREPANDTEVEAYVRRLTEYAAAQRVPDLFAGGGEALYRVADRNGVAVLAVRTTDLSREQLTDVLRWRMAQHVAVGFIDPRIACEEEMDHEPLASVSPDDVHVIAGSAATGEILCYLTIVRLPDAPVGAALRSRERPLLPVERAHGWGVYNRLRVLPDLPLSKVGEFGRLVKNQRYGALDELTVRAPVEVFTAVRRLLTGPLRGEVDAIVGDLEEHVAKRAFDFFHTPLAVVHGTMAYADPASYKVPAYLARHPHPFAFLVSDVAVTLGRAESIERALEQPGRQGLTALMALKGDANPHRSSLIPDGGLPPITDAEPRHRPTSMADRGRLLDAAQRLRAMDLFRELSVAEATVLATLMTRHDAAVGEVILRQGETADALFLIDSGEAGLRLRLRADKAETVATLGPGECFGEMAVLTGGNQVADVVALTPVTLLRVSTADYARYLACLPEVQLRVSLVALARAGEILRRRPAGRMGTSSSSPRPRRQLGRKVSRCSLMRT